MKYAVIIFCLAISQLGLGASDEAPKPEGETSQPQTYETPAMELRNIKKANFSGVRKPAQLVISDQEAWSDFWAKHTSGVKPAQPLPQVDFTREVVLVAAMGQKNTGGYGIEITSVRPKAKKWEVTVLERTPPGDAMTIQAVTAPVHIIACPIKDGKVPRFSWTVKKDRKQAGLFNKRKID